MDEHPTTEGQAESHQALGRTSATEREAITSEKFAFWLAEDVIVNPFDIVAVDQVNQPGRENSHTYGLVTTLDHRTDAPNHLANYISSNFGQLDEVPNTNRKGPPVASANVLSNTADIYMPVPSERLVFFAEPADIQQALGTDTLVAERKQDAIPAGLIKMSNGSAAVAYLDRRYLLGPESAHVNISGISGLATKTSYAMFLLQSILQKIDASDVAVIIMNVKHGDLLRIDEAPAKLDEGQKALWLKLGLEPKPFQKVNYFLPRGKNGEANSFVRPRQSRLYAYELNDCVDKLDLLFSAIPDPTETIDSLVGEISNGLINKTAKSPWARVQDWQSLLDGPPLFDNGKSQG